MRVDTGQVFCLEFYGDSKDMSKPICTIFAGPNGAGKTTFALSWTRESGSGNFINADLIAGTLSPLAPEDKWILASRVLLKEIRLHVHQKEDFAFETTLAGRTYLKLIRQLVLDGWRVDLYYLWLRNVSLSIERVAERVAHGGHNIPYDAIVRRYPRSIRNLLEHYAPLCSSITCMDNSGPEPQLIFVQDEHGRLVENQALYDALLRRGNDE